MNAQTKHTQGPWEIYESPAGRAVCDMIVDSDGKRICEFPYGWNDKDIGGGADARLIAAAPELLEALRKYRELETKFPFHGSKEDLDEVRRVCNGADAAIAKATGEQP